MPRRVTLPGADELFRSTGRSLAPVPAGDEEPGAHADEQGRTAAGPSSAEGVAGGGSARKPSRRQRHEEKITVYISAAELVELEKARLTLRAEHGLGIDRGRIVREALAVVLADLDAKGDQSILVRRLRSS
jgi:hypothetical protein